MEFMNMDTDYDALLYLEGPELTGFERLFGKTRRDWVDITIEESCWGDDCPYKGGLGSDSERFTWLKQAVSAANPLPLHFPQTWDDFATCVNRMDSWLIRDTAVFGSECLIVHFYPSTFGVRFKIIAEFMCTQTGWFLQRYLYFFHNELTVSYVRPDLAPGKFDPYIDLNLSEGFKRNLSSAGADYTSLEFDTYHDGWYCFKALDKVTDAHFRKMFGPDGINVFAKAFALLPPRDSNISRKRDEGSF